MNRRNFLGACAAVAGGAALAGSADAQAPAPPEGKTLKNPKIRISVPPHFFKDMPFEQQLERVAAWGAPAWEWLGPAGDFDAMRAKSEELGIVPSCIGGIGAIKPRQMVDASDHDRLEQQFKENVATAKKLGCKRLVGLSGNTDPNQSYEDQMANIVKCLKRVAPIAADNDVIIVMEALNPLVDHKGYFMTRTDQTMEILEAVDHPNVKMLFDIYHQQITEGNVIRNFTKNIDRIGHFHVADNPGRHQPGTGELNYGNIFKAIAETHYDGFVALEFGPTGSADEALSAVADCVAQVV